MRNILPVIFAGLGDRGFCTQVYFSQKEQHYG